MSAGAVSTGPFRGLLPFDETSGELFFGREQEADALLRLVLSEGNRTAALTGESGVGKTSLCRAVLLPALAQRGIQGICLGGYADLDGEILRATGRAGADPPSPGEPSSDYVGRIARGGRGGTVLILDHLEEALADETGAAADLGVLLARVVELAGSRVRFLLCIDAPWFSRLDRLHAAAGIAAAPPAWMTLERLGEAQAAEILERTALASGIFFETGLAGVIAADLCRRRPCLPADIQIMGRVVLDHRLTSIRKYQHSGGADVLMHVFFDRVCAEAGGRPALRILLDVTAAPGSNGQQIAARTHLPRSRVDDALAVFVARGILRARRTSQGDAHALIHTCLAERVHAFAAVERARGDRLRRILRKRVMSGDRMTLREIVGVRRFLGTALGSDEETLVARSLRRKAFQAGVGLVIAVALLVAVFVNLRQSYTLAYDPPGGGAGARVVVRLGRPSLSFLYFLPSRPPLGSILADTGFSAAGMVPEIARGIAEGRASGKREASEAPVPGWLRDTLNGLRPVPRGVAKVLLGDPTGITSLKHAFTDPLARRETLDALAVIGRGRAGEDEILAAALAEPSADLRRRAVEVAAAVNRRHGGGAHSATLRQALGDKSPDVRGAVLRESAALDPKEAAAIFAVALADRDPSFRRSAEEALMALADRAPSAAAEAVGQAIQSQRPDAGVRRAGMALLDRLAAKAPAESAAVLARLAADGKTAEEARVAALLSLRRSSLAAPELAAMLAAAVVPDASPRLRAAALPLYARLIEPEKAEEIARAEMKGPPAARAAGAAVWGAVAVKRPDLAAKPLKSLVYDPSVEIRVEAARALAYLKKDGIGLAEKMMKDGNAEVQRAAIESTLALAPVNPYAVADLLGRTIKNVRPPIRRALVEALGRLGETRPAVVIAPLAKALRDKDGTATRAAAAAAFCGIVRHKDAAAVSPYLRVAARDQDRQVREAAASCLGDLAKVDSKGAAKMSAELSASAEPALRAAAAESLGRLAGQTSDVSLAVVVPLLDDPERAVRMAAERALVAADRGPSDMQQADKALAAALAHGDPEERRVVIAAAARHGVLSVMRQGISDGDESVRLAAVRAAGDMDPPALDLIGAAVHDSAEAVRAAAARVLAARGAAARAGTPEALPLFEALLRGGDPAAREAAIAALGDLAGTGEPAARLLGEALGQRSESVRTQAALALGRLAEREPDHAAPHLERALRDPSYDVRAAAIPGLALAAARKNRPADLGKALESAEADSPRRFVVLEALVIQARAGEGAHKEPARQELSRIANQGPPLARLAAQIGLSFLHNSTSAEMHRFISRLLGG